MNRNNARAFLLRYRECCERVRELETEAEEILTTATHCTTNPGEHYQGRNHSDKVSAGATRLSELSERLETATAERLMAEREIFFVIDEVQDADHAEVLARHYLEFETFASIAGRMAKTERWISELHGRALDEVAAILTERSANG